MLGRCLHDLTNVKYDWGTMAKARNEPTTVLGEAIRKRIDQLGISRRELAKRSGISKQTIHDLEHMNRGFQSGTLIALDRALKWEAGTALAFHIGDESARDGGESIDTKVTRYFNGIMAHLATMTTDELERELLMLEEESFGRTFPNSTEALVAYEERLRKLADSLTETWEQLNGNVG